MSNRPIKGITISDEEGEVLIEVSGGRWRGDAAEAERLLTALHYALGRARPGTNIASLFVNDQLWGEKTIEQDDRQALEDVRDILNRLLNHVDENIEERTPSSEQSE